MNLKRVRTQRWRIQVCCHTFFCCTYCSTGNLHLLHDRYEIQVLASTAAAAATPETNRIRCRGSSFSSTCHYRRCRIIWCCSACIRIIKVKPDPFWQIIALFLLPFLCLFVPLERHEAGSSLIRWSVDAACRWFRLKRLEVHQDW